MGRLSRGLRGLRRREGGRLHARGRRPARTGHAHRAQPPEDPGDRGQRGRADGARPGAQGVSQLPEEPGVIRGDRDGPQAPFRISRRQRLLLLPLRGRREGPLARGLDGLAALTAMRFVVYGAGAIGGVIGGRLHEHGHDVVLVARGRHLRAIGDAGLRIESPDGTATLRIPAVGHPAELSLTEGDVVLLAVKSQDTGAALDALAAAAPPGVAVACAQNGVENERAALRLFPRVYGVHVMLPAAHLEPGVVQASSAPVTGLLDLGRYPRGADDTARRLSAALNASSFDSRAMTDVMRWKHRKLIMNLGNAVEALIEAGSAQDAIAAQAEE